MEFDSGPSVGVKGGWFRDPSSIFGLQADFNAHFPDADELGAAGVRAAMDADVRVLSASVNAIARFTEPALRPYAASVSAGTSGGYRTGPSPHRSSAYQTPFQGIPTTPSDGISLRAWIFRSLTISQYSGNTSTPGPIFHSEATSIST